MKEHFLVRLVKLLDEDAIEVLVETGHRAIAVKIISDWLSSVEDLGKGGLDIVELSESEKAEVKSHFDRLVSLVKESKG